MTASHEPLRHPLAVAARGFPRYTQDVDPEAKRILLIVLAVVAGLFLIGFLVGVVPVLL